MCSPAWYGGGSDAGGGGVPLLVEVGGEASCRAKVRMVRANNSLPARAVALSALAHLWWLACPRAPCVPPHHTTGTETTRSPTAPTATRERERDMMQSCQTRLQLTVLSSPPCWERGDGQRAAEPDAECSETPHKFGAKPVGGAYFNHVGVAFYTT